MGLYLAGGCNEAIGAIFWYKKATKKWLVITELNQAEALAQ
jgi:hypothetical protein